ncbi:MAG TPA: stage V sporulation protein B [Clostridiaceae bacterium]|nr:stage V sporulation protein B [Clostridiaceae bacterium]
MVKRSFVSGALILAAAGFVVRILGFIYRIYLSNLIGAEGMGLFQLISPVYSLVILTLTSGVSIAVSRMVAGEFAKGHYVNLRRITSCAAVMVLTAGIIVSLFILLEIDFITGVILKDKRTYYSMLLLIPGVPVIAAASALKGYFYGIQNVTPTAFSQITEQIVRIGIVMLLARYSVGLGLEYACALATVGMALGEISNLSVLFFIYKFKKGKMFSGITKRGFMRKREIVKNILKISVPVSSNRFIMSVMAAVEFILIPRMLEAGGLDYQESIELYGRLTGMAAPLIFFPSLVTSSLATTLVPAISEAMSLKNYRSANYRISKSMQITFILGFVFSAIFMSYPDEIGNILYKNQNVGWIIHLYSFTCVFIYLQQTMLGILNGLGKQGISLRNSMIGYLIRIGFVYFCVPVFGIKGYIWGVIISSACVCILDLITIMKVIGMYLDVRNWIVKPGFIGVALLICSKYVYSFFTIFSSNPKIIIVLTIGANLFIAALIAAATGLLPREDIIRLFNFRKYQNKLKI